MKQTLRLKISEKRKALSREETKEKSNKIKEKLYSLDEFKEAKNIMVYVSFNNEVDTHEIIKELVDSTEKKIIVPYVEKNNPILQLSEVEDFDDLEPKTLGILEPKDEFVRKVGISKVDLVIVPGMVFDSRGYRIGYGHGYYDRFLKKLGKDAKKIGFAFELQLIDKVPEEKYDVPMDIIVTEKRVLKWN
jgi:5-formyltetrahydrofolate cyclo-ligase|tara:strand:- start:5214 stop:5783 length:570 start_codon:yes stop_codon:yes gene_type:complete